MSCQNSCVPADILVFQYLMTASRFNQYFLNHNKMQNVIHDSDVSLVLIILFCVFFLISLCSGTNLHSCIVMFHVHIYQHHSYMTINRNSPESLKISVLQNVCIQCFINCLPQIVILSHHDQLAFDIRPRCWPRLPSWLVNFEHPQSTYLLNVQRFLIMTQWITLQYLSIMVSFMCTVGY